LFPGLANTSLYTHSWARTGLDEAWIKHVTMLRNRTADDPCLPSGYHSDSPKAKGNGTGSFKECMKLIALELPEVPCNASSCGIAGVPMPPVVGAFLAGSGYFYTPNVSEKPVARRPPLMHRILVTFLISGW
jgi:hypothetical protein